MELVFILILVSLILILVSMLLFILELVFKLVRISKLVEVYRTCIRQVFLDFVKHLAPQIARLFSSNIINVFPQKIIWEVLVFFTFPCHKTHLR